jgi:hypothetical protein
MHVEVHVMGDFGKASLNKDFTNICCLRISKYHFHSYSPAFSTTSPIFKDQPYNIKMEALSDEIWDVVIAGTSIPQSLLAL